MKARRFYSRNTRPFAIKYLGLQITFFGRPQLSYNQKDCLRITSSYRDANSNIFHKITGMAPR